MDHPQADKQPAKTVAYWLRGAVLPAVAALACSACVAWPTAYSSYGTTYGYGYSSGYGYTPSYNYYDTGPLWTPRLNSTFLSIFGHRETRRRWHAPVRRHDSHRWRHTRRAAHYHRSPSHPTRNRGNHRKQAWRTGHGHGRRTASHHGASTTRPTPVGRPHSWKRRKHHRH